MSQDNSVQIVPTPLQVITRSENKAYTIDSFINNTGRASEDKERLQNNEQT